MHIVINISEKEYKRMKLLRALSSDNECLKYILEGTPLPKGHGRLGDLDALREEVSSWGMNDYEPSDFTDEIDRTPTIIEADRESGVVFKTICNSCVVCHKETIDPDPFYICDACKEKLKADKGVKRNE